MPTGKKRVTDGRGREPGTRQRGAPRSKSHRMGAEQEQLYYLVAPSRESALASAYMEALKAKDLEVG